MSFDVQFPGLGLEFTINRVALSIGGFNIYWYGVIIAAGMVLAMLFAFRNADDFGINSDRLIDVILVGAVMAIVCARIYYIVFAPFKYESIWQMIDIRQGGIAIYGAVIGAFVFGGLMARYAAFPSCRSLIWLGYVPDWSGRGPLGQLCQPGSFRQQHHAALGHVQRGYL